MNLLKGLSKNQKIAFWGVIVTAISGIAVPIILNLRHKKVEPPSEVDVNRIDGNGTVIGDHAKVTVDKRIGVDAELILERVIKEAEAKGRAELQEEQLKEQLAKAVERIKKLEAEGNRPDAEKALEELRQSGDMKLLQKLLIKDRDEHRDVLIRRNREIAAVAYLRGDIDIANEAVNEILKELPDDLFALKQRGNIHRLWGDSKEAEVCYRRVLQLSRDVSDEAVEAAALGNLAMIYMEKGELDKAEEMCLQSLEISERGGMMGLTASQYGNLGAIYLTRGELDKAEKMFRDGLKIDEKLGRLEGITAMYSNLGLIYQRRGERDKAKEMYLKSLEIAEKLDYKEIMAALYSNLGSVYRQRGDIQKAKEYWEKALGLYKRIGMPHMVEKVEGWINGIEN